MPKYFYIKKIVLLSNVTLPEDTVVDVVKNVFVDLPPEPNAKYHFDKDPPKITGQIGVPVIVDRILGIMAKLWFLFLSHNLYKTYHFYYNVHVYNNTF